MGFRLFAAAIAGVLLASPATAQDPRGARVGAFGPLNAYGGAPGADAQFSSCRRHAFYCGVRAYDYARPREAATWFQYGARRGSVPAMRALGVLLMRGDGQIRDDPEAGMGWLYEAALRGDATSMYALSVGFERGLGVAADPALARFWLERAARAGSDQARQVFRAAQ